MISIAKYYVEDRELEIVGGVTQGLVNLVCLDCLIYLPGAGSAS
jgi:hypothetical protein